MIETYQSTHLKSFFEWRRRRWECVARGPKAFKWSFDLAREFLRELFPFYLIDYRTLRPAPFRWWVGGWLVDRRLSIMYLVFVCCQPQNVLYVCKMIGFVFQTVEFSLDRFSCRLNICIWFWSLFVNANISGNFVTAGNSYIELFIARNVVYTCMILSFFALWLKRNYVIAIILRYFWWFNTKTWMWASWTAKLANMLKSHATIFSIRKTIFFSLVHFRVFWHHISHFANWIIPD